MFPVRDGRLSHKSVQDGRMIRMKDPCISLIYDLYSLKHLTQVLSLRPHTADADAP